MCILSSCYIILGHKKSRLNSAKSLAKLQGKFQLGMAEVMMLRQEKEEAAQERKLMREEISALRERLAVFESRLNQIYKLSMV